MCSVDLPGGAPGVPDAQDTAGTTRHAVEIEPVRGRTRRRWPVDDRSNPHDDLHLTTACPKLGLSPPSPVPVSAVPIEGDAAIQDLPGVSHRERVDPAPPDTGVVTVDLAELILAERTPHPAPWRQVDRWLTGSPMVRIR